MEDSEKKLIFVPCKFCKGLYKKESLSRHVKKCTLNSKTIPFARYGSEGQTVLAFTESRKPFLDKLRVKNEVFKKMRVDRISLTGKSDPIICQYAEDYLRKHKRPHITNLVSNKIRELGRLLCVLQDTYSILVYSILQALKPENSDKVVSSAKVVTKYSNSTKEFKSALKALHFRMILITVCSTAVTLILKKDPILLVNNYDEALKDINNFKKLVSANWKFEIGSLAQKNLTEKHSLHPQKLPITKDIIIFNNYCLEVADIAAHDLNENYEDFTAFRSLSETVLALTISLNRKRVGDVQYIKIESYESSTDMQQDCFDALSEEEKHLSRYFKRIVTIGKGSRAVPILFPKKQQQYVNLMLRTREHFIPKQNPYLFGLTDSSNKWIDGSCILKKYADSCGAENPERITSSRLRKQIATVLQILNLNDIEIEQLATFMGHTKKTHEEFYRLPQDIYQTSKIAKLLSIAMRKGVSKEDQGETIAEIDTELEFWNKNENTSEGLEQGPKLNLETENLEIENVETENLEREISQTPSTSKSGCYHHINESRSETSINPPKITGTVKTKPTIPKRGHGL